MCDDLKRWALSLALGIGLALPLTARAQGGPGEHSTAALAAHEAKEEAASEGEPANPAHGNVVSVQAQESAWIVIIFLIVLIVLYPTAWKQVLAGLKAREDRIRKDITDAEAARVKSESMLREYHVQISTAEAKVREMLSTATAEGERIATTIRMQAQQESEGIKERALKDIDTARRQALQEIYAQAAEISTSIAEKILRRNLNADDQRELVNQSLEQLQHA